jgi:lysophospholipase L1-like esterase
MLSNAVYNSCIRTNTGGWYGYVDPGLNSPVETRLNNPADTNYFAPDGLHLNNAGYGVMADHFGQVVNVPHRTTGYFGP